MLNCAIIDDEPKAITSLKWELEQCEYPVHVLETFTDAEKAISYLKYNAVDFIFLDVEMPSMDGFNFLEKFQTRSFQVVFVTAHNEYAIHAIKEQAFDYLLKPVESDDLALCIQKLYSRKQSESDVRRVPNVISIPVEKKLLFIEIKSIEYCKSDGNYTEIYTREGEKIVFAKKLKFMEHLLPPQQFFRTHNSYIVNLDRLKEYHRADNLLILQNNVSIPIARSKKMEFLQKL